MTLWDLITALCSVMPLAGALATVRGMHKGWVGYGLAVIIGIVVGGLCAFAMRAAGNSLAIQSAAGSAARQSWYFRVLYIAAVVWAVVALFLGSWLTAAFIHHI
jgi:hypothetical protein